MRKVPGIEDIDTRDLTLKIREKGSLKAALATEEIDDDELVAMAREHKSIVDLDLVPLVSTPEVKTFGDFDKTVAIIDCGVKKNIIKDFLEK